MVSLLYVTSELYLLGLYSADGADSCSVCEAGHYCGSNETTWEAMTTGGGSWENNADDAGECFNGTYCAAGMTRAPGDIGSAASKRVFEVRV